MGFPVSGEASYKSIMSRKTSYNGSEVISIVLEDPSTPSRDPHEVKSGYEAPKQAVRKQESMKDAGFECTSHTWLCIILMLLFLLVLWGSFCIVQLNSRDYTKV